MSRVARFVRPLRGFVFFIVLFALWQFLGDPNSVLLPPPSKWWISLQDFAATGVLWKATYATLTLFLGSLIVGTVLGATLGLAIGGSALINKALGPTFEYVRTIPAIMLIPPAIILFGVGLDMQIGVVVVATIWPVLLGTAAARRALPEQRFDVARTLNFGWWRRMRQIVLPSVAPEIAVGVRIAAPICIILVMLVDFMVGGGGLGSVLLHSQQSFRSADAWGLTFYIGALGIVITFLIDRGERFALRHYPTMQRNAAA